MLCILHLLQSIKTEVSNNESKLDDLKSLGDDIATRGKASLVQPYEQQIYKRWDDLENKIKRLESDLDLKIKRAIEIREEQEKLVITQVAEMQREIEVNNKMEIAEEQVITPESVRAAESSAFDFEDLPIKMDLVTKEEPTNEGDELLILRRQAETPVRHVAKVTYTITTGPQVITSTAPVKTMGKCIGVLKFCYFNVSIYCSRNVDVGVFGLLST